MQVKKNGSGNKPPSKTIGVVYPVDELVELDELKLQLTKARGTKVSRGMAIREAVHYYWRAVKARKRK